VTAVEERRAAQAERKVALAAALAALREDFADLISAYAAYWPPRGRQVEGPGR
jgi:hypothetical protein